MFSAVTKKLRRELFSFSHDKPYDFAVFSWQSKRDEISGPYLVYRFVTAALFLSVVIFCTSRSNHPNYWFIYLSHIGLILQAVHLAISAAVPVQLLLLSQRGSAVSHTTRLARISWFLYNVTNLLSILISVVFWSILFTPAKGLKDRDFLVHGLNIIMSIFDIFISKRPCRMMHFHHPLAILVPYVIFTGIYWAAGGLRENGNTYIYPILNWDNLNLTVPFLLAGLTVGLLLNHTLVWALHLLRDRVLATLVNKENLDEQRAYGSQWNSAFVQTEEYLNGAKEINPPTLSIAIFDVSSRKGVFQ